MKYLIALLLVAPSLVSAQVDLSPYNVTALEIFTDIDTDSDGRFSLSDVDVYFGRLDADGDGEVTLAEFTAFVDVEYPEYKGYEKVLYDFFDINGDGTMDRLGLEELFVQADMDGDDIITEKEFLIYFVPLVRAMETVINNTPPNGR